MTGAGTVWSLTAVGETGADAALVGAGAVVATILNLAYGKYKEWRALNRTETKEDRELRRKEAKEDEAATVKLLKETIERLERERERERKEAAERLQEDREEVHQIRDRLSVAEMRVAVAEIKVNRMRVWIRHLQALLTRNRIDFEPYSDDPTGDTDIHRAMLEANAGSVPPNPADTPRPKEGR